MIRDENEWETEPGSSGPGPHGLGSHGEPFELPLEMYFAQAPAERDAEFESGVLSGIGLRRGFTSRRDRRLITAARCGLAGLLLAVVVGLTVADRTGLAPWSDRGERGPVGAIVASAGGDTDPLVRVTLIRDDLAAGVETRIRETLLLAERSRESRAAAHTVSRAVCRPVGGSDAVDAGPYLSAGVPATCRVSVTGSGSQTAAICFDDGFRVPTRAAAAADLRWPSANGLTDAVVLFDGLPSASGPIRLAPAWYNSVPSERNASSSLVSSRAAR